MGNLETILQEYKTSQSVLVTAMSLSVAAVHGKKNVVYGQLFLLDQWRAQRLLVEAYFNFIFTAKCYRLRSACLSLDEMCILEVNCVSDHKTEDVMLTFWIYHLEFPYFAIASWDEKYHLITYPKMMSYHFQEIGIFPRLI